MAVRRFDRSDPPTSPVPTADFVRLAQWAVAAASEAAAEWEWADEGLGAAGKATRLAPIRIFVVISRREVLGRSRGAAGDSFHWIRPD